FFEIHRPVPGIDKVNQAARSYIEAAIGKGPYVRFVWGFATDRRLNHHPEPPPGMSPESWRGRTFDAGSPSPFLLRIERQQLWGLPAVRAAVFLIRVSFVDGG